MSAAKTQTLFWKNKLYFIYKKEQYEMVIGL